MISLPEQFIKTIKATHKITGEAWLSDFNRLVGECEERFGLKVLAPFELSYNFVAPAVFTDGNQVVIKLCVPSDEFVAEVETLERFNKKSTVKIIDVDIKCGVLILERLEPGTVLAKLENDVKATQIAASVMKSLWTQAPLDCKLPTTLDRAESLIAIYKRNPQGIGPITKAVLEEAVYTFNRMNENAHQPYLLHGDLHHYNILMAGTDSWKVIDPKGLVGEREYDVIQFLLNRLPNEDIGSVIEKRIDILVETLHLDKKRILAWGFSHAVLATCWSLEDEETYCEGFYKSIEVFKDLHHYYYGHLPDK